jgi:TonB family protein
MPHLRRLLIAAVSLLALQACSARSPSAAPRPAAERDRGCATARVPAVLPAPGDLLDVPRFRADAGMQWALQGRPRGVVVFSLRHAPDGTQVRRAVIESSVPAAFTDSLQRLAFTYRREAPPATAEWGVRLRLELGDSLRMTVARPVDCPARPRDREFREAGTFDVRQGDAASSAAQPPTDEGTVWVRVRVDERGQVTDARVERGIRRGVWEQRLLNWVRSVGFDPATEDGYPVPFETTIPVRLSALP